MQEEGAISQSEGLVDLQVTEPEKEGGQKFKPKLFQNFRLDEFVPETNFYRILKNNLDLSFIYKSTKSVYSHIGRLGLDPVVFFKMNLQFQEEYYSSFCSLGERIYKRVTLCIIRAV